jgi:hypothetical protein
MCTTRQTHAVIPEGAHVGAPENLRLRGEVDAVARCGDTRDLRSLIAQRSASEISAPRPHPFERVARNPERSAVLAEIAAIPAGCWRTAQPSRARG